MKPFVSVVTPVYNGAAYLEECIESVLRQSLGDFEYVILDNASTDDTPAIANSYAERDGRIRLLTNDSTVPFIENWNRAVEAISGESAYCKILHADDFMYPDCLRKMVDLAEANPSVGVVASLRLRGDFIECKGLPEDRQIFKGGEIVRPYMRQEIFSFAPTSALLRSELVRSRKPFYPTKYIHADLAVYFDILDQVDFGFIHETLSFSRTHDKSITTTLAQRKRTLLREWPALLQEFGPRYFDPLELRSVEKALLRRYYRVLVRSAITRRGTEFMDYHLSGLRKARRIPTVLDLGTAIGAELAASLKRPVKFYRELRSSLVHR